MDNLTIQFTSCFVISGNGAFAKFHLQRKYDFVWSIAQRVGINVTIITSVDVVGVCIFKVALTVYQMQIPNLDTPNYLIKLSLTKRTYSFQILFRIFLPYIHSLEGRTIWCELDAPTYMYERLYFVHKFASFLETRLKIFQLI